MAKEYLDLLIKRCGVTKIIDSCFIGISSAFFSMALALILIPDEPMDIYEKENKDE